MKLRSKLFTLLMLLLLVTPIVQYQISYVVAETEIAKNNKSDLGKGSVTASIELDDTKALSQIQEDAKKKCEDKNTDSKVSLNKDFIKFVEGSSSRITCDMDWYTGLTVVSQRIVMREWLDTINTSNMSSKDKARLYNFVAEQDESVSALVRELSDEVNSDFASAMSWFQPFKGPINTILGIIAILIITFTVLTTLIDLAYLSLPVIRSALEGNKTDRPKLVSNEAYITVQESEAVREGSYLGRYFRHRIGMMVMLMLALAYLCSGEIYMFVAGIIETIQHILGVLVGE